MVATYGLQGVRDRDSEPKASWGAWTSVEQKPDLIFMVNMVAHLLRFRVFRGSVKERRKWGHSVGTGLRITESEVPRGGVHSEHLSGPDCPF